MEHILHAILEHEARLPQRGDSQLGIVRRVVDNQQA
jgi:hypothetical protein